MRFRELAAGYDRLDATTKRLEMRSILVDLIRPLNGPELADVLFLSQGVLRPEYEGLELGVAHSLARRALASAVTMDETVIAELGRVSGDLGTTAAELLSRAARSDDATPLEVREVYDRLTELARSHGSGSQEAKVSVLTDLLRRASPLEAKYLLRFVLGTLRVGVREMSILDALASAFAPDEPEARERIEAAFNLTSDLGAIGTALAGGGLPALAEIRLEVGRPIRPMLAERAKSLEELLDRMDGRAALEYKYDGLRLQAHVARDGTVRLFSRRLEEVSAQYPDLAQALPAALRRRPAILEGECVSVDPQSGTIRPFQDVARRRGRTHGLDQAQASTPVVLFAFDLLLLGEERIYDRPFPERRAALAELLLPSERIRLAEERVVSTAEEAGQFFDEVLGQGAEGILAKSVAQESRYRPGARGFWWIKYKRDYVGALADSIDGVVVGAFHGRGRRGGQYGALLLAVFNPKRGVYESFTKVGSGFDDATLEALPRRLAKWAVESPRTDVDTGIPPDQWFRPGLVIEVKGAELTVSPVHRAGIGIVGADAGLALRFPRFTGRYREDKGPTEATTTEELVELYRIETERAAGGRRGARVRHKV
ncbi:MAG: ATP-dependent DNA ligase [Thermoplasmata archaeon]